MGLEQNLKIISTYGLAVFISATVIYFAIRYGHIHLDEFKQKHGLKKHDELAIVRNQISTTINTLLERTLLKTHACRVYIFEFHNGAVSMSGLPFLKMTNTYEVLDGNTRTEMHKRENMPFQLFSSFVEAIYSKDYLIMDVDNRTNEYSQFVYETLVERDIAITVRTKITDINKRVIGYLGIDYTKNKPIDEAMIQKSIQTIQDAATEIGALLTVKA